eukprot:365531-Chlamydomonas_euryale.AAC.4
MLRQRDIGGTKRNPFCRHLQGGWSSKQPRPQQAGKQAKSLWRCATLWRRVTGVTVAAASVPMMVAWHGRLGASLSTPDPVRRPGNVFGTPNSFASHAARPLMRLTRKLAGWLA